MSEHKINGNGKWTIWVKVIIGITGFSLPFIISMAVWSTLTLFQVKEDIAIIRTHNEHMASDFKELKGEVKELKKMQEPVIETHYDNQYSLTVN